MKTIFLVIFIFCTSCITREVEKDFILVDCVNVNVNSNTTEVFSIFDEIGSDFIVVSIRTKVPESEMEYNRIVNKFNVIQINKFLKDNPVVNLSLTRCNFEQGALGLLEYSSSIQKLHLGVSNFSNNDLKVLDRFPNLKELYLNSTNVGNQVFYHFVKVPMVEIISLADTKVKGNPFEFLNFSRALGVIEYKLYNFKNLKSLNLDYCQLSDKCAFTLNNYNPHYKLSFEGTPKVFLKMLKVGEGEPISDKEEPALDDEP